MSLQFTKMHGAGNDYVYVNCLSQSVGEPEKLAVKLSNRHFGIGADGLVLIMPSDVADFRMRMFNADGSEGRMCGNAIRCVGKYVYDRRLTDKVELKIETMSGIKDLHLNVSESGRVETVTVGMGVPKIKEDKIISDGRSMPFMNIDMGNPHAVTFTNNPLDLIDLTYWGPKIASNKHFQPEGTNVEFVRIKNIKELQMRVWERGSGETLACGTGACAAVVAACFRGYIENEAVVHLKGGDLQIKWNKESGQVLMTGPAEFVFDGTIID